MNKKLTAKTQKLVKTLPTLSKSFASSITIEPEESDLIEKRGVIYSVFDLTVPSDIDPLLVTKIVNDVLFDSYYSSDSISPIQALEKALVNVKDKVVQLAETQLKEETSASFNILAAVLWGNVLYMVQFGKGGSFLVRENAVKPVNSATEGSFSVASGIVKDEDVIILATQSFLDSHTIQDLVSGAVSFSMHDLPDSAAAFLLKFDTISEFTEQEKIDFNLGDRMPEIKPGGSKMSSGLGFKNLPKISLTKVRDKKFSWYYLVFALLAFGLMFSVFTVLKNKGESPNNASGENSTDRDVAPVVNEAALSSEELAAKQKVEDEKNKISRVDAKFFYDLKLVEESATPSEIVVLDNQVVVSDKASGKVYISSKTTPKFELSSNQFVGITNLNYFGGDLSFTDNEGYKVFDLTAQKVIESYAGKVGGPAAPYLAFVYGVSGNVVQKYQLLDSGLSATTWATSEDFSGANSIAIDGNIYILKPDGLVKYLSGQKTDFSLDSLDKKLSGAVKVVKDVDFTNVYVADARNKRILVLDEKGGLVKQILSNNDDFDDIKSISLSRDEKILYILSGSKVFEVAL
uniref:Uncharacterized protein n=1 Tax=candidate division WWE3 bacterium TaxID=2053526 RepID=A0A7C4TPD0_UNCKA